MKIRLGFVSNSSTSSFCIYGTSIENLIDEEGNTIDELSNPNIDTWCPPGGEIHIGRSLTEIKDDQTFKEFKDETKEMIIAELKKMNIKISDLKFGIHQEGWYNG